MKLPLINPELKKIEIEKSLIIEIKKEEGSSRNCTNFNTRKTSTALADANVINKDIQNIDLQVNYSKVIYN